MGNQPSEPLVREDYRIDIGIAEKIFQEKTPEEVFSPDTMNALNTDTAMLDFLTRTVGDAAQEGELARQEEARRNQAVVHDYLKRENLLPTKPPYDGHPQECLQ